MPDKRSKKSKKDSDLELKKRLSDQFRITLKASLSKIEDDATEPPPGALQRCRELLGKDPDDWSWSDAYEVEQLLVQLFDDATLQTELERRLLEARWVLRATIQDWYEQAAKTESVEKRRTVLLRLINDLQWKYTRNEDKRELGKAITVRTAEIFVGAILLFGAMITLSKTFTEINDFRFQILLAGLAGAWGASFSMLTSLKTLLAASSADELKMARSWALLFARVLTGMGAALILYFFLTADLLSGGVFPDIQKISDYSVASAGKTSSVKDGAPDPAGSGEDDASGSVALLIVWCFLAGFSEKLVLSLLSKTEAKVSENGETTPYHPGPPSPPPGSPPVAVADSRHPPSTDRQEEKDAPAAGATDAGG